MNPDTMVLTENEVRQYFEKIRVDEQDEPKVYKPLLLLFVLGRYKRKPDERLVLFEKLEREARPVFEELSVGKTKFVYPFWYLKTTKELWEVEWRGELQYRKTSGKDDEPTITSLRAARARGGLTKPVFERLMSDERLLREVSQRLLKKYFPESQFKHSHILSLVGLVSDDDSDRAVIDAVEKAMEGLHGQGHPVSQEKKRAIELYAEEKASEFFGDRGYSVEKHGAPFDLLCKKEGRELYVEVKGTQSAGKEVFLTKNEVDLAKNEDKESVLFIQHSFTVEKTSEGEWAASSEGLTHILWPWQLDDSDLTPKVYKYRVPSEED